MKKQQSLSAYSRTKHKHILLQSLINQDIFSDSCLMSIFLFNKSIFMIIMGTVLIKVIKRNWAILIYDKKKSAFLHYLGILRKYNSV